MTTLPKHRAPTHPGEMLLEEFLEPLGMTQSSLADLIHVSYPRVNEIINRKRGNTPDTALRLARLFGTTPKFWLNRLLGVWIEDHMRHVLSHTVFLGVGDDAHDRPVLQTHADEVQCVASPGDALSHPLRPFIVTVRPTTSGSSPKLDKGPSQRAHQGKRGITANAALDLAESLVEEEAFLEPVAHAERERDSSFQVHVTITNRVGQVEPAGLADVMIDANVDTVAFCPSEQTDMRSKFSFSPLEVHANAVRPGCLSGEHTHSTYRRDVLAELELRAHAWKRRPIRESRSCTRFHSNVRCTSPPRTQHEPGADQEGAGFSCFVFQHC